MKIGIVVICHSVSPDEAINSVQSRHHTKSWHIFFHGSSDTLERHIFQLTRSVDGTFYPYRENRGVARSWNDGIHASLEEGCEMVLLLNDDAFFYKDNFDKFVSFAAERQQQSSNFGAAMVYGWTPYGQIAINQGFACVLISKNAIEKAGYFDENFHPAYYEDQDYGHRLGLLGFEIHIDERVLIQHERGLTTRTNSEVQATIATMDAINKAYHIRKWGGTIEAVCYAKAFDKYPVKIEFCDRSCPYGKEFDRQDRPHLPAGSPAELAETGRMLERRHALLHRGPDDDELPKLDALAAKYGSDKWNGHWYATHYETHFSPVRHKNITLLEIGVGGYDDPSVGGASLRAWKDYFPNGTILGLDCFDKAAHAEDRIHIYRGSQADPQAMSNILADYPMGFDIVIDDGSHRSEHVIATLLMLWQYIKDGGYYVIEATQTSYWPQYGGSLYQRDSAQTTMGYLKSLIDAVNWEETHHPLYSPSLFDRTLQMVSFYHNMVFLRKGVHLEGSTEVTNNRISGVIG